jgi:hypothetical protein
MNGKPARVFISYSRDSEEHIERVLQLSDQLRTEGIDSRIDRYEQAPTEGWPGWCVRQIEESEFVLLVCTKTYKRRFDGLEVEGEGRGSTFEGRVILQAIFDDHAANAKFIPVALSGKDVEFIPRVLRNFSFYNLARPREYEDLYRRLTHQPKVTMQPIGEIKQLPAKSGVPRPPLGPVRDFAPASPLQAHADVTAPLGTMASSTPREKKHAAAKLSQSVPTIYATFELRHGEPVVKEDSYKIWIAVNNVPDGTRKVNYEIHDDSFPDPKFSVKWGTKDFAEWITSYGDVFLSAKGRGRNGPWEAQTTLAEALRISYGRNTKANIRRAIAEIENN